MRNIEAAATEARRQIGEGRKSWNWRERRWKMVRMHCQKLTGKKIIEAKNQDSREKGRGYNGALECAR